MTDPTTQVAQFSDLGLPPPLLAALEAVGYETPTPIQAQAIPCLLQGLDLLGHAPTGTGKTAAFTLPLLARLDLASARVQILVLAPTRELAIQVAEAFQRYASKMRGFHVLPIYGGQEYSHQLRHLRRGVHVVVGTPGRVMDHMRRGTLKLNALQALVLDEADEMLRMGFIDDVEWILEQTPERRQMALFSATMPREVQKIVQRHLHNPRSISIASATATAATIRQRYWLVSGMHKLDALTRLLEVEPFEGLLMFVRTKIATVELAERLEARGHAAAAINGDMPQKNREMVIDKLKKGTLDILVATDVAARGLDVDRISHVVNYDVPHDTESYIHRIGRTGRAGRTGEAILFIAPREQRMLKAIERATRQPIERLELPSTEMVNNKRIADFKQSISDTLAAGELEFMRSLMEQYQQEHNVPALDIAAALAKLSVGDRPMLLKPDRKPARRAEFDDRPAGRQPARRFDRSTGKPPRKGSDRPAGRVRPTATGATPDGGTGAARRPEKRAPRAGKGPDKGMQRFRIEVGHRHEVKPGNIVGAIANEAGLDSQYIGRIDIENDYSFVDLPAGMPREVFDQLRRARVCGRPLNLSLVDAEGNKKRTYRKKESKKKD